MKVSIVFDYNPDLGPDPLDKKNMPRRTAEFLDSKKQDVLVAWRDRHGRVHVAATGRFDSQNIKDVLA